MTYVFSRSTPTLLVVIYSLFIFTTYICSYYSRFLSITIQKPSSILRQLRILHRTSAIFPRRPLLHRPQPHRLLKGRRAIGSEIYPLSHGVSRAVARASGILVFGVEDVPDFRGVGAEEGAVACGQTSGMSIHSVIYSNEGKRQRLLLTHYDRSRSSHSHYSALALDSSSKLLSCSNLHLSKSVVQGHSTPYRSH